MSDSREYERAERLVHAMAEYVNTGRAAFLLDVEAEVGARPLRLLCVNALGWLSSRSRFPTMVSHSKRYWGSSWATMSTLLSVPGVFAEVFGFEGEVVVLKPGLTPGQILELCRRVTEIYQPRIFITRRRPAGDK